MIYLDHAATTPLLPEVRAAMEPYLGELYFNPNALYRPAKRCQQAIEAARAQVAAAICARPDQIVFTAGGTEAINQVIFSIAAAGTASAPTLITSAFEHHAVLEPLRYLKREDYRVVELSPDPQGVIRPESLEAALDEGAALVSIMAVQNEVGTVQPIRALAEAAHAHGAPFLTDAIQGLGKIPLDVRELGVDYAAFSAHKIGGPKGIGALYARDPRTLQALVKGGGQERGLRSGTQDVAAIVGFAAAAALSCTPTAIQAHHDHLAGLRAHLLDALAPLGIAFPVLSSSVPDIIPLILPRASSQLAVLKLDEAGFCVSGGAACSSSSLAPSHVLTALGIDQDRAYRYLRVSPGPENTLADLDALTAALAQL
jgi:cysteine desulfurase